VVKKIYMSVLTIQKPKTTPLPIIFDSPHSGTTYPSDFKYDSSFKNDFKTLQRAEDKFVEDLFASVPSHGGTLLCAEFPRTYIDTNRAIDDIDPQILDRLWQGTIAPTPRSDAGIGLIRRLIKPGIPLYKSKLSQKEITHRINIYYRPYHDALADLIEDAHYNFGCVYHINCHSMPNSTATPKRPPSQGTIFWGTKPKPADFVLGDRDGRSCDPAFTRALKNHIQSMGYSATINDPFKGVELIEKYSNPTRGYHSLQLEINKSLYMNEETCEKNANYEKLKRDIESIITFIATHAQSQLTTLAAD